MSENSTTARGKCYRPKNGCWAKRGKGQGFRLRQDLQELAQFLRKWGLHHRRRRKPDDDIPQCRRVASPLPRQHSRQAVPLYTYTPPPGVVQTNRRVASQIVSIRDARPIADQFSLDRHGFALRRHTSAVVNFYDEDEVRTVYYPECEQLLQDVTGSVRVVVFDHIVRCAPKAQHGDNGIKEPAKGAHNDYTLRSGPQRLRDLLPTEAETLLAHRFAIINVWRPIRGPVQESPLAVCDAQSLRQDDFITSDLMYPHRRGEIYTVTFRPAHQWYYFP